MKKLHQDNLYCWSEFDPDRDIDFHSYVWVRPEGNVVFDPLPLTEHDRDHLDSLGGVSYIIISNSDHIRAAKALVDHTGAEVWGPLGEQADFPLKGVRWLEQGKPVLADLDVFSLNGSKTAGELAFVIEGHTLITGDLIRSHAGGKLCMLPNVKLSDRAAAIASVKMLAAIPGIDAVLPGDGWPIFAFGEQALAALVASFV